MIGAIVGLDGLPHSVFGFVGFNGGDEVSPGFVEDEVSAGERFDRLSIISHSVEFFNCPRKSPAGMKVDTRRRRGEFEDELPKSFVLACAESREDSVVEDSRQTLNYF